MAKSKTTSGADPSVIRFRCMQCGATLKVSIRQANRYIECPKCKNRTHVPASQRLADEEARDYEVNKLAYDTTGTCRNCGAKMAKKSVVCVACGFDYRTGKVLELIDKTKLPEDFPTWKKIWSSLGDKEITNTLTQIVGAFAVPTVFGLLLFAVAWGLAWYFTSDEKGVPSWPYYAGLALFGVAILAGLGMVQQAMVETCGRGLYGRAISAGAVPVAALYFLINFAIAFALPIVLIAFVGLEYSAPEKDILAERSALDGFPRFQAAVAILPAVIIGAALLPVSTFYFFFAVGTFAADLSVNPITVGQWIVKAGLDSLLWFLLSLPFLILSACLPFLIGFGVDMVMGNEPFSMAGWIFIGLSALVLVGYTLSALPYTMGMVFKRHL